MKTNWSKLVFQGMCWYLIFWTGKQLWTDACNKWKARGPHDPEAQWDYD